MTTQPLPLDVFPLIAGYCDHTTLAQLMATSKKVRNKLYTQPDDEVDEYGLPVDRPAPGKVQKMAEDIETVRREGYMGDACNPSYELCKFAIKRNAKNYQFVPAEFNERLADYAIHCCPRNIRYVINLNERLVLKAIEVYNEKINARTWGYDRDLIMSDFTDRIDDWKVYTEKILHSLFMSISESQINWFMNFMCKLNDKRISNKLSRLYLP